MFKRKLQIITSQSDLLILRKFNNENKKPNNQREIWLTLSFILLVIYCLLVKKEFPETSNVAEHFITQDGLFKVTITSKQI